METEIAKYNVFLRIKPLDVHNVDDRMNTDTLTVTDSAITTRHNNKKNEIVQCHYNFKKVFKPSASQSELFDDIVCPRLLDFFQGNDSLMFSYGTSNSGKSFTMQGTPTEPGIIPRVLHSIFQSIEGHQDTDICMSPYMSCQAAVLSEEDKRSHRSEKSNILENLHDSQTESHNMSLSGTTSEQITMLLEDSPVIPSCLDDDVLGSVWISFYEIYNEHVFDLLAFNETSLQNPLKLVYDKEDDSYHPLKLKEVHATTWDEAYNFYRYGKRNLRVAETLLNRKSSRSHCVFTVKLLTRSKDETDQYIAVRSFILCDLAGSERMKHTDNMGKSVVKEMLNINASLLTLNKCFVLLKSDSHRANRLNERTVLPYRDSKLTMLFKKFLKGQGELTMVANISQEADMYYQTEQVLKMTSLAHKTRVEKKPTENLTFKLPLIMPKRRFSIMIANEQTSPVSGLRPNRSHNLLPKSGSGHLHPNSDSQDLYSEVIRLKKENSDLVEEMKKQDLEYQKLVVEKEEMKKQDLEYQKLLAEKEEESRNAEANLRSHIMHLESRLETQGSNAEYFKKKMYELEDKYRKRVLAANTKELEYCSRLTAEKNKMDDLMNTLKTTFSIPESTGPVATVQQVVYLYTDMVDAATEEVAECEKIIDSLKVELQKVGSERDNEIANLKGRLMESETMRQLEEVRLNNRKRVGDSEADDEIATSPDNSDSDGLLSNARVKSHGKAKWVSDDESSPLYIPPRSKTTAKKKKKKTTKRVNDIPYYESSSVKAQGTSSSSEIIPQRRRARRKLMGNAPDYLGDNLQLDHTLPDTQLSPGSIMKMALRSGKR